MQLAQNIKINQVIKRTVMSRYHFVKYSMGIITKKVQTQNPTNKPYVTYHVHDANVASTTVEQSTRNSGGVKQHSPEHQQEIRDPLRKLTLVENVALPKSDSSITQTVKIVGIKVMSETRDASGCPLKTYEQGHILIGQKDDHSGIVTVDHILTSSKTNFVTKKENPTIDVDNYMLSGKPQRVGEFETGRVFPTTDKGKTYLEDPVSTAYLQRSNIQPKVETIIKNSPPRHHTVRLHKDDSSLYTEDGRLITEEDNVDRTPLP